MSAIRRGLFDHSSSRPRLAALTIVAACCLLFALSAASFAEAAPPLIAQWPLNESHTVGSNDVTDDVSGNGLALLSAAGTMKFGTEGGKFGGYLSGANTTNLQVDSPLLAPQQVTLLAWIKQSGNPGTLRYIAGRGDDGPTCSGSSYALYTGYPGEPGLHFYVRQNNPGATSVLSPAPPDSAVFDGNWHLVAGTFDGANIRLYVDGNQAGAAKPASSIGYGPPMIHSAFYVDGYPPQASCLGASDFPGLIDETRVYDRALSQAELARLAAAPGPTPPTLEPDPEPVGPSPTSTAPRLTLSSPAGSNKRLTVFKFDVNSAVKQTLVKIDNKPAFSVSPSNPYLGVSLNRQGNHFITGVALGFGGASVTQTTSFKSPGSTSRLKFPDTAISAKTMDGLAESLKNSQCVPDSVVYFGAVEAQGCFRKIDPVDELPSAEKDVAEEFAKMSYIAERGVVPCIRETGCSPDVGKMLHGDPALKPFVASSAIHLNGMTITPVGKGANIVVFPAINRIVSSNARISYDGSVLGSIPVKSGPLNLDLQTSLQRFTSGDAKLRLFEFDTSKAFEDIGGFPINGRVDVVFQKKSDKYSTSLKVDLSLPEEISTAAGANPTARVELNADNQRGTYLGELNIHVGEAFLGPVEIANVDFTYNDAGNPEFDCPRKFWKATAEVFFVPIDTGNGGTGLKMAPEPQRNGVAFCAGEFHSAGATLVFGQPEPELFPGLTLSEIGFSFQLQKPVIFDGHVVLRAAHFIKVDGGILAAFATPTHPYTFKAGDAGGALASLAGKKFSSITFAVGGGVKIEPTDDIALGLASGVVLYEYPNYIYASGEAHFQTFLFSIDAGVGFDLNLATRRYNAFAHGRICLAGGIEVAHVSACAGGEAHISSRGVSACFNIADGTWTPGVGYLYGNSLPEFFAGVAGDGCKPSKFWEVNVRGARVSAGGGLTFRVQKGEKAKTVELTGAGGAPAVTVSGPGGEQLASETNQMLHSKHLSAIHAARFDRTWIGVSDAKPGVYKIVPQPGSAAIANVRETHYEPNAEVKASVTGSGRRLVLSYDAGHAAGQSVSFFEHGKGTWELLKTVKGGKGKLKFTPGFGAGGKRTIAAQVEINGIPAPLLTLDRYKAPPPPTASRVKGVKVVHRGSGLSVSWEKAPFAQAYAVVVDPDGGTVRSLRVKPKRHSAKLKGVSATEGGVVEVVAFGPLNDRGKPGRAKFKALRTAKTRLLSYKELGSGFPAGVPAGSGKPKRK